jgi:zinc/manganese transport system substrate-binding protein
VGVIVAEREEGGAGWVALAGVGFRRILGLTFVAFLAPILAGCGGGDRGADSGDGPVEVVATYSILGDLVENVGGQNVGLTTLVGPNGDAHTFEPAPSDNVELAEADVIFENGLGFEPWLDDLYGSSGSDARRVVVTREVGTRPVAEEAHADGHADGHADEEQETSELDPHVWHDVNNAVVMVKSIRDALSEADPENAATYEKNAGRYISELEALDADVRRQVGSIPGKNRILFTSHDTFGYFAGRYGFEVDTALASASTETGDPSAGGTAELVEEVEASGVPAIFGENVSDPEVMEAIAAEAGVELAPPLYTDALGGPGNEGGTYVQMVRYNVSTMSEALRQ